MKLVLTTILIVLAASLPARADVFAPFKDKLFGYPAVLEAEDKGAFRIVDYHEPRDIYERDQTPERRAWGKYVSLGVRKAQQEYIADTPAGKVRHFAVGKTEGASVIVVYLHGSGGSRHQGVNDYTFGGNFNRIKNLAVEAGGLYLSPDVIEFGNTGAAQIASLLEIYAQRSPKADIYVGCGSMGGIICWSIADNKKLAPRLGGLLMIGSMWSEGFLSSIAFQRRVPVYFGQGTRDEVFPVPQVKAFYKLIREKAKDYPVQMVVFNGGSHGTPIRMTDWRETINWMAGAR